MKYSEVGYVASDGWAYCGVSPENGQRMYVAPADESALLSYQEAIELSSKLHKIGHVPTMAELNVIFNNAATLGGFNQSNHPQAGWYWSSTENVFGGIAGQEETALYMRFSDGRMGFAPRSQRFSVRMVRYESEKKREPVYYQNPTAEAVAPPVAEKAVQSKQSLEEAIQRLKVLKPRSPFSKG